MGVYIREAHAGNVWPIGDPVSSMVHAPETDADRCKIAKRMAEDLQMSLPIYVDRMGNAFETCFAPWPFRFYIVDSMCCLCYKAQPTKELTHCPCELEEALRAIAGSAILT